MVCVACFLLKIPITLPFFFLCMSLLCLNSPLSLSLFFPLIPGVGEHREMLIKGYKASVIEDDCFRDLITTQNLQVTILSCILS